MVNNSFVLLLPLLLLLLLFIISLSFSPAFCVPVRYYVTPTSPPSTDCLQPCYTLDYYALNPSLLSNKENVSLLFIKGLHTLSKSLKISGKLELQLTNLHSISEVIVNCNSESAIKLEGITQLKISNLTLYGGVELTLYGSDPKALLTYNAHAALLQYLTMEGFQLVLVGNSSLNHCELNNSTVSVSSDHMSNIRSSLTLFRSKTTDTIIKDGVVSKDLKLTIIECTINRHRDKSLALYQGTIRFYNIGPAATLYMRIEDSSIDGELKVIGIQRNSTITLLIHHSDCKTPMDLHLINFSDTVKNNNIQVQITDSKISGINLELNEVTFANTIDISLLNTSLNNNAHNAGIKVLTFKYMKNNGVERLLGSETMIRIAVENCTFINKKVAIIVEAESTISFSLELMIITSIFYGNENAIHFRSRLPKILTSPSALTNPFKLLISLRKVTLGNNSPHVSKSGVIRLVNVDMLNLEDCRIINNQGTAVESYYSSITLIGDTLFSNNTSIKGGALLLYDSFLYLTKSSNISFFKNYAQDVGGAIYTKQRPYFPSATDDLPPCLVQIDSVYDNPKLNFKSNLASNGGDDIYGGSLYGPCRQLYGKLRFHLISMAKLFHFRNKTLSSVTSDPTRVCLCDDNGSPQCSKMEYIYKELSPRYPGEVFTVPAVVVGNDFGTVPGIVYSKYLWKNANNITLSKDLLVQEIRAIKECAVLNLSIQSHLTNTAYEIQLNVVANVQQEKTANSVSSRIRAFTQEKILVDGLLSQQIYISLILHDCPTGFMKTTTHPYICTCHTTLENNDITVCIISNHTGLVYRSGTIWVSDSFSENNSFVIHQYCPFDYCKSKNISVDLQYPDVQCALNHSGVLCGGCYGNLSLALGTSRCLLCDNRYVPLLIVFVLAGIVLVFVIKVLDLTVAKGTINGLIFYANIVWANKSILFPNTETLHPAQQVLHTFIAWLNLDLGIETCFIDGLNAYWKTWLQFVFPLYVWTITGVMIIASHYSTRASKIFGNNSVPVLATLILLSYAKLLRTIIISLGFILLSYPEGTRVVWSFDGNVPYFGVYSSYNPLSSICSCLALPLATIYYSFTHTPVAEKKVLPQTFTMDQQMEAIL